MKAKNLFLILLLGVFLLPLITGNAFANFYIPYIYGTNGSYGVDDNPYPAIGHFQWIDTGHSYGYSGNFTYTNGSNLSYEIGFKLYAPDNWDDPGQQNGHDYTGYKPEDDSYVFGGGATDVTSEGGTASFDDVYSYFYTIKNTGTDTITALQFDHNNATLEGYGQQNNSDAIPSAWSDTTTTLTVNWNVGDYLEPNETSTLYLTSESWYGLETGTGWSGGNSASGDLPSPNPEAPTVGLYIAGLFGMIGYTRMKRRKMETI